MISAVELTHWSFMGHGVHAEGQLLFRVLVKFLPERKRLGDHLALLDPLGFIVTTANNPAIIREQKTGSERETRSSSHVILGRYQHTFSLRHIGRDALKPTLKTIIPRSRITVFFLLLLR